MISRSIKPITPEEKLATNIDSPASASKLPYAEGDDRGRAQPSPDGGEKKEFDHDDPSQPRSCRYVHALPFRQLPSSQKRQVTMGTPVYGCGELGSALMGLLMNA